MKSGSKPFLRSAVIMTLAALTVILLMNEWGAAQIITAGILVLLAAGQWGMFFYLKK